MKKYLLSSECIFHVNLLISWCFCEQRKDNSATVRDWEPGLQTGTGKAFSGLVAQAEICLKLYNKLQIPLTFLFSVCLLLLLCSLALGFV